MWTLKVKMAGTAKIVRYEFDATTEDEVEIVSPSGEKYSLVVEFYENDEASVSVGNDERILHYVRTHGGLSLLAALSDRDQLSAELRMRG